MRNKSIAFAGYQFDLLVTDDESEIFIEVGKIRSPGANTDIGIVRLAVPKEEISAP